MEYVIILYQQCQDTKKNRDYCFNLINWVPKEFYIKIVINVLC